MYRNFIKPFLDFIISLILIILLWPLMIVVMIIILIDLGFPLQNLLREREGKNRKPFVMYKFRTKVLDADGTTRSGRYSKVSTFIDKSRLNELPQLFNVLIGQMSLVGPRPFIPGESQQYEAFLDQKRYMLKPGITGLAQVNGARALTVKEQIQYDVEYYDNLSFLLDLKIILKTLSKVICLNIDEK